MKNKRNSQKGFTLVEAAISIALLGIMAVMLLSAFFIQYSIIQRNNRDKASDKASQKALETELAGEESEPVDNIDHSDGTFIVTFNGVTVDTQGEFITGEDENGGYVYKYFQPEE